MKSSFDFEGADDFDGALEDLVDLSDPRVIIEALTAGAEVIADYARPLTAVRTGRTRASITTSTDAIDARPEPGPAVYVGPTTDVPYALAEELGRADSSSGHGTVRPHPFMRPAFDMGGDDARGAIVSRLAPQFHAAASRAKG